MISLEIQEMMTAGAHFGHQTKRWNPRMKPYIYGIRSGVHIIDLQQTKVLAVEALGFLTDAVAKGSNVLFVGTKQQAREVVRDQSLRAKMHYVNQRWMGGTLTNFKTIKKSIDKLIDLQTRRINNDFEGYTKKELLDIDRTIEKLEGSLGGIKALTQAPDILVVIDPNLEHIAVGEAKKLGIPVVALTDTNCDPAPIDYVIPGNDDAISSIEYFATKVADAILVGLDKREQHARTDVVFDDANSAKKSAPRRRVAKGNEGEKKGKGTKSAYVSKTAQAEFEGNAEGSFSAKVDAPKEENSAEG